MRLRRRSSSGSMPSRAAASSTRPSVTAGAVVRAGVGPAGEVDDLVRLDARGARIDRVGADAGEVVDLPRRDGAVVLDADLRLHAVVARVDVGDKTLDPVGHELHRSPQQL